MLWLSAACYFDYRKDKIPNVLIGFGMFAGLLFMQQELEIGLMLLRIGVIFGIFYPLYKLGMLGAGDVKLFCLLAFYLKGRGCAVCIAGSMVIAALIGLGKFLIQGNLKERICYFCSYVADVAKYKEFRLYFENEGWGEKKKASLHMAGTVLLSVLLYEGGVYGVFLRCFTL
ncbi:MAG: prepilin peptidase [Lachnospiraceae bacterium]|nr:prepilin peptidase [Lachnospiraceae bacterium]